jgi:hypothetical protein
MLAKGFTFEVAGWEERLGERRKSTEHGLLLQFCRVGQTEGSFSADTASSTDLPPWQMRILQGFGNGWKAEDFMLCAIPILAGSLSGFCIYLSPQLSKTSTFDMCFFFACF